MAAVLISITALVAVCGCSYISHADREVISSHQANAAEFDRRIQAAPVAESPDAPLPAWIKAWSAQEARAWAAMHAWAKREAPSPTTQPAPKVGEQ